MSYPLARSPRSRVLRSVVHDWLALVLFGIAAGLPFVFVGGKLIAGLIVGVSPHVWTTAAVAIIVVVGVGVVCSLQTALRAACLDPGAACRLVATIVSTQVGSRQD